MTQSEKALRKYLICQEEKIEIETIIRFLEKLEKITLRLSAHTASIFDLPLLYNGLLLHLESFEQNSQLGFLASEMKGQFLEVINILSFKFRFKK